MIFEGDETRPSERDSMVWPDVLQGRYRLCQDGGIVAYRWSVGVRSPANLDGDCASRGPY